MACLLLLVFSCKSRQVVSPPAEALSVTFLQINDVYEIAPLAGGSVGGMARVATLREQLLAENPHTYTVLAGDFLNPSVIGTVAIDGQRVKGAHMVEVMNQLGVDYVAFGNHEFDLDEQELQARLDESTFTWVGGNVAQRRAGSLAPFQKEQGGQQEPIRAYEIIELAQGTQGLKIGLLAVTLQTNQPPYVHISDPFQAADSLYRLLAPQVDLVVGLTHLALDQDMQLARQLPQLPLIMGGHEHDHMHHQVGNTVIAKADANAKTAYVHRLTYDPATRQTRLQSELVALDERVPLHPEVDKLVQAWEQKAYEAFKKQGFNLNQPVADLSEPLDGREASIRNQPTNLGMALAHAMYEAWPGSELGLINSGAVRLDDQLQGSITEFDLIRALPFGGTTLQVQLKGRLLRNVLEAGEQNRGKGGYLQHFGVAHMPGTWLINGQALDEERVYRVAISGFLMSGREENLEFLTPDHPDVLAVKRPASDDARRDVRLVLAEYLKKQ